MTPDERALVMSLWCGLIVFASALYLVGGFVKSLIIGVAVTISCLIGYGRRWLLRVGFLAMMIAIAVAVGALPPPPEWGRTLQEAHASAQSWFR